MAAAAAEAGLPAGFLGAAGASALMAGAYGCCGPLTVTVVHGDWPPIARVTTQPTVIPASTTSAPASTRSTAAKPVTVRPGTARRLADDAADNAADGAADDAADDEADGSADVAL